MVAWAATPPGTSAQVAALVAKSTSITRADSVVRSELSTVGSDNWASRFKIPQGTTCGLPENCVYGSPTGTKTVVIYGDSHARMWLSAINPSATKDGWKVVLIGRDGCPVPIVTLTEPRYLGCATVRKTAMAQILKIKPSLILLANRTSSTGITAAKWQSGMVAAIKTLQPTRAKIIIIQDVQTFTLNVPECIASYPNSLTKCSIANPNLKVPGLQSAEKAAALTTSSGYLLTNQWICTTSRCSAVVGDFISHFDQSHLTASYARYLSSVMGAAIHAIDTAW
jgi:hypothetical protein